MKNVILSLIFVLIIGCTTTDNSRYIDYSIPYTSITTKRLPTDIIKPALSCIEMSNKEYCSSNLSFKGIYTSKEFFIEGESNELWSQLVEIRIYNEKTSFNLAIKSFLDGTKGYRGRRIKVFSRKENDSESPKELALDMLLCNKSSGYCESSYAVFLEFEKNVVALISAEHLTVDSGVIDSTDYVEVDDKGRVSAKLKELNEINLKSLLQ